MLKLNYNYRVICCYCGKKITLHLVEEHMINCLNEYNNKVQKEFSILPEYYDIFAKIRNDEFNIAHKEIVFEGFNKSAIQSYEEYYLLAKSVKNVKIFKERINSLPVETFRQIFENNLKKEKQDFSPIIKIFNKSYERITLGKILFKDLSNLICFICGKEIAFSEYCQHINNCASSLKLANSPKNAQISNQNLPNFSIILEVFKELNKLKGIDRYYINFIIKEFNLQCKNYFKTVLKNVPYDEFNLNDDNYSFLRKDDPKIYIHPISIFCYICGTKFESSFDIHYYNCKEEYNNTEFSINYPIHEPDLVIDLLKKIENCLDALDEIKIYNIFAKNTFLNVFSKFKDCGVTNEVIRNTVKIQVNRKSSGINLRETENKKDFEKFDKNIERQRIRKKSMDDIRNYDIKQIRKNIKNYFI